MSKRITPAGAGKTLATEAADRPERDHPRRCGENRRKRICTKFDVGSPPQVRGKPNTDANAAAITRITPAGAGKTLMLLL